jgi:hypothetical protein
LGDQRQNSNREAVRVRAITANEVGVAVLEAQKEFSVSGQAVKFGDTTAKAERRVVIVDDEEVVRMTVLSNDAGASCEDSFPDPKAAAVLFRASLDLIPDTGMDAAANSRVLCQA